MKLSGLKERQENQYQASLASIRSYLTQSYNLKTKTTATATKTSLIFFIKGIVSNSRLLQFGQARAPREEQEKRGTYAAIC